MSNTPSSWDPQDMLVDEQVDLREYIRILKRHWWILLLTLVVSLGASIGMTSRMTPVYEARARLFVGQSAIDSASLPFATQLTHTSLALVKSYAEAIKTRPIADDVAERLGLTVFPDELLENLSATPVADTQIIRLTYRDPDPRLSERVVNAFATSFVETIEAEASRSGSARGVELSVLEPAVLPTAPVSPQPLRNHALATVLGLMLGAGIILLAAQLDRSVKERSDAEDATGSPVLGIVPRVKPKRGQSEEAAFGPAIEAYGLLRSSLQYLSVDGRMKVLLVTSAAKGEGKTTTAMNLARACAAAGKRTVLVGADLRRPSGPFARPMSGNNLTAYLTGHTGLKGLVRRSEIANLYMVAPGPTPIQPAELLAGDRMRDLLASLKRKADLVVIDSPPLLAVSDSAAVASLVDGVLLVARAGKTTKDSLRETVRVLQAVGASVVGVVLNGASRSSSSGYGYGYGYGYGPTRTARYPAEEAPAATNGNGHRPHAVPGTERTR
ncbi:MAG TPA: polysaccharide biosynthesis tyrosine autokinase [Actinomycetota bacterium]|nr:polysaccharide biosynthesis tyrosine autokinase [Actinomycetota bacterium]